MPITKKRSAADFLPAKNSLKALRAAAAACRGCDLYKHATQTVFGEGKARAKVMFVGEQPGDREDLEGHPFVGPAGELLRTAMLDANIDPGTAYITNAVKHFKFVQRGKRRIHAKPRVIEMRACEPWLEAEVAAVRPALIVALGTTAVHAVFGSALRLSDVRGKKSPSVFGIPSVATAHPSSILRAPDPEMRALGRKQFAADMRAIAKLIA